MSHITYNEFKNRFGDLGITYYVKYNWLSNFSMLPNGYKEIAYIKNTRTDVSTRVLTDKVIVDLELNIKVVEYLNSNNLVVCQYTNDSTHSKQGQYICLGKPGTKNPFASTGSATKLTYANDKFIIEGLAGGTAGRKFDIGTWTDTVYSSIYEFGSFIINNTYHYVPCINPSNQLGYYCMEESLFYPWLDNTSIAGPVIKYLPITETVINPAIKIEGELGRFLNAQGEWTTGSTALGAFKYEVTGGHTYDVVNAKAASSSYIMFLDADGNRIGNVVAMSSTNYPKVGDTRPMQMPDNCKYV